MAPPGMPGRGGTLAGSRVTLRGRARARRVPRPAVTPRAAKYNLRAALADRCSSSSPRARGRGVAWPPAVPWPKRAGRRGRATGQAGLPDGGPNRAT
eukprot:1333313-Pyramimonas_sp.AAC.1